MNVALLRWAPASTAQHFNVGSGPTGIAFDGFNIWVADYNNANVSGLRAYDGALLGHFCCTPFLPKQLAWDGVKLWVTGVSGGGGGIVMARLADGTWSPAYNVGKNPYGIAFDGTNIWVANTDDNTITKLRASDGAFVATIPVGAQPHGVAFDGANIWIANTGDGTVTKVRATDNVVLGTFTAAGSAWSLAFDGTAMWVGGQTWVVKLANDGTTLTSTPIIGLTSSLVFDGYKMWASQSGMTGATALRLSDGAVLNGYTVGQSIYGLAFDGAHIWASSNGDNTVSRF